MKNGDRKASRQKMSESASNEVVAMADAYDVVIVGAGIIGLTIARHFLISSDLSVAIIDKEVPCSGSTGAGIPTSISYFPSP